MDSSRLLLCSSALWLVVLGSASLDLSDGSDHEVEQSEITFDHERMLQRMITVPVPDIMQRPVDLSELFDLKDFVRVPQPENSDSQRVRGPARPRSFQYHVQFPLARPSSDNLQAICSHSAHRPRYPKTYFPSSGYGQQKRRADAVNNAEFWFSGCCEKNATWGSETTLCCATQAWKRHIESFCKEDTSVKDLIYQCCRLDGRKQLDCFHNDAPNPSYDPTEELPVSPIATTTEFSFEPSTCQRPVETQHSFQERSNKHQEKKRKQPPSSQKASINFPPGRPTADNVESLCQNQKLRPLYSVKCLAGPHYKLLTRQTKSMNRIEKGFKQCCKKKQGVLECVEQKWREELDTFCEKQSGKKRGVQCCLQDLAAVDRFKCFQDAAPDPHYNVTSANEGPTLKKVCEVHKLIKKKFPAALPLKAFVSHCCPLAEETRTACFEQKIRETSTNMCSSKKNSSPALRRCCSAATEDAPGCFFKLVMDAVTKVAHNKKRKRCPLQS
ncbi:unnamed protein product [Tetraodon nigroviridis]|uniref:(spotted green pufferfish) hypothetical protein n=1 Tax=Tetraodon nigroviridis TaxID=99883 RepID=Q4RI91_TETNG|nr:unnamed protein product [Tetraodon nigroviridis]